MKNLTYAHVWNKEDSYSRLRLNRQKIKLAKSGNPRKWQQKVASISSYKTKRSFANFHIEINEIQHNTNATEIFRKKEEKIQIHKKKRNRQLSVRDLGML